MLFFWRGHGWAVVAIFAGTFVILELVLNFIFGDGYYQGNEWPKTAAPIISATLIAGLGYIFNYRNRVVVMNAETGKKEKQKSHSLFFIPIEYWAVIVIVLTFWG